MVCWQTPASDGCRGALTVRRGWLDSARSASSGRWPDHLLQRDCRQGLYFYPVLSHRLQRFGTFEIWPGLRYVPHENLLRDLRAQRPIWSLG